MGRLELQFAVDTNFVDDPSPAAQELRAAREAGWVRLFRTDVMDTEIGKATDPEKRSHLLSLSGKYVEQYGPVVWGHSRWDHAVWGSEEDAERLDRAIAVMFPGSARDSIVPNNLRDAMHVATAIRYGMNGLVTRNERGLLKKSTEIADAFDGFVVATPDEVLETVDRFKSKWLARDVRPPREELDLADASLYQPGEDRGIE